MHLAALLVLLAQVVSPSGRGAGEHLLAGAGAFRESRFQEALVEFRVAQKLGSPDAAGYAGATLVKLGRAEEALVVFAGAARTGDALLNYYRAIACYDARLYLCADRLLAEVEMRSGPRVVEEAAKVRAAIRGLLSSEPAREAIDWYLARCNEHQQAGRAVLAAAYCQEAADLAERRKDRYGKADAVGTPARQPAPGTGSR